MSNAHVFHIHSKKTRVFGLKSLHSNHFLLILRMPFNSKLSEQSFWVFFSTDCTLNNYLSNCQIGIQNQSALQKCPFDPNLIQVNMENTPIF